MSKFQFPNHVETLAVICGHEPRTQDYLRLAYLYAWENSQDPKTKNGSVLMTDDGHLTYGCNHLPEGIAVTEERFADPKIKDPLVEHAETDSILKAGRDGHATRNGILYCCWAPCVPCARAIISSGLMSLITHKQMHDRTYEKYRASIETAIGYLREAGVAYNHFDGFIGGCRGRMADIEWEP